MTDTDRLTLIADLNARVEAIYADADAVADGADLHPDAYADVRALEDQLDQLVTPAEIEAEKTAALARLGALLAADRAAA